MNELLVKMLDMSFKAGIVVLVVVALRLILKKAPKWLHCLLWALVAIRLVCPFSIDSNASFFNLVDYQRTVNEPKAFFHYNGQTTGPKVDFVLPVIAQAGEDSADILKVEPKTKEGYLPPLVVIWMLGMGGMLTYMVCSYLGIQKRVRLSVNNENNIFLCDDIDTPFILGIIRPRIYIPSHMTGEDYEYILAHERAHIQRLDHLWKPVGFLLLAAYWFNPILWLGYILLCRDIEQACDEKVIRVMERDAIAGYTDTLLKCSIKKRRITACPLAFGETAVKTRIKAVLHYKKPAFWVIVVSLVLCVAAGVFFMTDSKKAIGNTDQIKNHNVFFQSMLEVYPYDGWNEAEARKWYQIFLEDGVKIEEGTSLSGLFYGDLDNDRVPDVFITVIQDEQPAVYSEIYGYLGERRVYYQRSDSFWFHGIKVSSGDINRDGLPEIAYITDTGGCGGSGSWWKGLLQYRDGKFVDLPLPGGYGLACDDGEAGYAVEIYTTDTPKHYLAKLLEEDGTVGYTSYFTTDYLIEEMMPDYDDSLNEKEEACGERLIGYSSRGYDGFEIRTMDGRDYLWATQYLCAGCPVNGIGQVVYRFEWDDDGEPHFWWKIALHE